METITETKKRKRTSQKKEVKVHTAFGQEWSQSPEYSGYTPEQYQNWDLLKNSFYGSGKYGHDRPLPVNIKKGNKIIVVRVYGFKLPEPPRVALCEVWGTRQKVAIAW